MGKYNMFTDLKTPRDITRYTLFRGTTDFSQLQQFDLYESGYPMLIVVSVPEFLQKMAAQDTEVQALLDNYIHILEYEFRGFQSGLQDMSADLSPINNGNQEISVITKVNGPTGLTFSANYYEKSGAPIHKLHDLYLRSVKDPASGLKTYNGLIGFDSDKIQPEDAGFHKECFSFLYFHTDNTGLLIEQAAYIVGAVPTGSFYDQFNGQKGQVDFSEVSVEFSGFPLIGSAVNTRAKQILDWMNSEANNKMIHRNSWDFKYAGITDAHTGLAQTKLTSNNDTVGTFANI